MWGTWITVLSSRWLSNTSPHGHRMWDDGACDGNFSPASRAIAAGAFATQPLGGHRLGVIGPERDGVNLVTGVNHERIDRSHRATADNRNLRHSTLRASSPTGNKPGSRGRNQDIAGRGAARLADIALEPDLTAGEQPQRFGIDAVFDRKDPRPQRIRRIVIANSDRALHQNRAGIGLRNDKMHGSAGDFDPGAQRLTLGVEAGK